MCSSDLQYLVEIEVKSLDRAGLLNDLSHVLSEHQVNILSGSMSAGRDQVATARFTFELPNINYLESVLTSLRRVDGVFEAARRSASSPSTRNS